MAASPASRNVRISRLFPALVLAVSAAGLGACGGDDEAGSSRTAGGVSVAEDATATPAVPGADSQVYLSLVGSDVDDSIVSVAVKSSVAKEAEITVSSDTSAGALGPSGPTPGPTTSAVGPSGASGTSGPATVPIPSVPMGSEPLAASVAVPAGLTTELGPEGPHIVLREVKKELATGDRFKLTLDFEHGPDRTVTVSVGEGG